MIWLNKDYGSPLECKEFMNFALNYYLLFDLRNMLSWDYTDSWSNDLLCTPRTKFLRRNADLVD